MLFRVSMNWQ